MKVTVPDLNAKHPILGGFPKRESGQMEEPRYAEINAEELAEIEAELGHSATRELAQWFIRNRMNRDAVERMLATDTARLDIDANLQNVRDIKEAESRKAVSVLKKAKKKCA